MWQGRLCSEFDRLRWARHLKCKHLYYAGECMVKNFCKDFSCRNYFTPKNFSHKMYLTQNFLMYGVLVRVLACCMCVTLVSYVPHLACWSCFWVRLVFLTVWVWLTGCHGNCRCLKHLLGHWQDNYHPFRVSATLPCDRAGDCWFVNHALFWVWLLFLWGAGHLTSFLEGVYTVFGGAGVWQDDPWREPLPCIT